MKNKFDEMTKDLAQSVTRRQALRRFGAGLAGMALAVVGLASKTQAAQGVSVQMPVRGACPSGCYKVHGVCICGPR